MLRPEVCTWKSGMRIRYNVSCLEAWIREQKFAKEVLEPLQPLNEVAQVLQARKMEDEDALTITELCPTLTTGQVMKVSNDPKKCLNRMTPFNFHPPDYQILHIRRLRTTDEAIIYGKTCCRAQTAI